jgi:Tol biopolymer transport system component
MSVLPAWELGENTHALVASSVEDGSHVERRGLVFAVLVAAFVGSPVFRPAAEASFPGRNGLLAVSRFAPGEATTIWLVDPRSGRAQQLTQVSRRCRRRRDGWQDSDPSFSASGRLIVYQHIDFYECDPRTPDGIYVIRVDGRGRRRLPVNQFGSNPVFSPSGNLLAFSVFDSIFIRDLKRPPPARELREERGRLSRQWTAPSWGVSGRLALTVGPTFSGGHIATMRPNGRDFRLVTHTIRDQQPDWSPQGDRIVFSRVNDATAVSPDLSDILVAPARTRRHQHPKRLTHTRDAVSPTWSPDGRAIALIRETHKGRYDPRVVIMRARGDRQRRLPLDEVNRFSRIAWQPLPRR